MFYHQKVARVRVFADIQNFALRAWHSNRGMYAKIAISRLCQEESLKGLKDERLSTPFT